MISTESTLSDLRFRTESTVFPGLKGRSDPQFLAFRLFGGPPRPDWHPRRIPARPPAPAAQSLAGRPPSGLSLVVLGAGASFEPIETALDACRQALLDLARKPVDRP